MDGAKGSALEWALALLQAPGERHLLRQKALPDGMEPLLAIAAGAAPEALAQAMATFGESESRLREAAQFYVREVLFFPQADAYRMLGVAADAPFERIKAHHRLLQSWLHPDRPHSEEDAAFAARVNAAWNRLRSPERRREYDAALRNARPPEVFDTGNHSALVPEWRPVPEPIAAEMRWRRRLPILALIGLCVVLAVLAMRDADRGPASDEVAPMGGAQIAAEPAIVLSAPQRPASPAQPAKRPLATAGKTMRAAALTSKPARAMSPHEMGASAKVTASPDMAGGVRSSKRPPLAAADSPLSSSSPAQDAASPVGSTPPVSGPPIAQQVQSPASEGDAVSFVRIQSAREVGDQLLGFLRAARRPPPPIWNSPGVQEDAESLRRQLHARGRLRLSAPNWWIGRESAEVTIPAAIGGMSAMLLVARLHWRDGYWLVTGIDMEDAS